MPNSAKFDPLTEQAIGIWWAGVQAVRGECVVHDALQESGDPPPNAVLAVGKAAASMLSGALSFLPPDVRGLLVTKHGHADISLPKKHRIKIIESGHPIPDANSLAAGQAALEFVTSCKRDCRLLVLVSGGASALMEAPVAGIDLGWLCRLNQTFLSEGYSIDQINHMRIGLSRIKGGRLLRRFQGQSIRVLGISDIPGDQAALIGSGIGAVCAPAVIPFEIPDWIRQRMEWNRNEYAYGEEQALPFRFRHQLVGSNAQARVAASRAAEEAGLSVVEVTDCLNENIEMLAVTLAERIGQGGPGVYLWGGEPIVQLPPNPGTGGRSQGLALALTLALGDDPSVRGVIAGTDGTDGPTHAAGGIIGPMVDHAAGRESLLAANAGAWLDRHHRLFITGPTGTNVMDLAVLIKGEDNSIH